MSLVPSRSISPSLGCLRRPPLAIVLAGCMLALVAVDQAATIAVASDDTELVTVAESERLWTGVAVSGGGRIFVNYPRWSHDIVRNL